MRKDREESKFRVQGQGFTSLMRKDREESKFEIEYLRIEGKRVTSAPIWN
jgi:hypothetical protein